MDFLLRVVGWNGLETFVVSEVSFVFCLYFGWKALLGVGNSLLGSFSVCFRDFHCCHGGFGRFSVCYSSFHGCYGGLS